jgi:hypothetical protein
MSFDAFKEVTINNPGSSTRYGSDDVLDVMKILNGKVLANRRPEIANRWRWVAYQEIKQMTEASVPTPTEANVVHLFQSATDNKLKVKKTGGTIINLEDIGSGTWSNTSTETFSNKTVNIDTNTIKHSTTNATGDIMFYDATAAKYIRLAKGTASQALTVNASGTTLEWGTIAGGGGGGESNTASNVGTAGIGAFYQKLGVDLQFKSFFSPDGSVNISDDTGNQKIDLTLPAGVAKTGAQNTFGDFQNTFRSSRLAITNPANTAAYFWVGSAIAASRNITLPLLAANDQMTCDTFATNLLNKTLGSGTVANTDVISLKHSTTNLAGELMVNTGTKFDRFGKGTADSVLKVNSAGTNIEWGTAAAGGGIKLPDGSIAATTGRWGAFFGGSVDGMGMMGLHKRYFRVHGTTTSASESVTNFYADSGTAQITEIKTACGFRRDSSCVFKAKWQLTSSAGCKVKIGLSDATDLPAGGSGQGASVIRYDVSQSGSGHLEFDGPTRFGVRFDAGASGLNEAVTEVVVRFRKYGTPSGSATVGIRKNSDGTLISLGTFTPNSFGSGEQTATISAPSNTYLMVTSDRVSVEFPSDATDGMELDEDDTGGSHTGYTCQSFTGSTWSTESSGIGMRIKTAPSTPGNLGDTPLINANGVMVHGTIGTHTNYQVARNNAAATQTTADSGIALANTTAHTVEFNLNSTNIVVTLDGTAFTYTTVIPGITTPMAFWMHIESTAAAEKGIGIVYAQVVMAT